MMRRIADEREPAACQVAHERLAALILDPLGQHGPPRRGFEVQQPAAEGRAIEPQPSLDLRRVEASKRP